MVSFHILEYKAMPKVGGTVREIFWNGGGMLGFFYFHHLSAKLDFTHWLWTYIVILLVLLTELLKKKVRMIWTVNRQMKSSRSTLCHSAFLVIITLHMIHKKIRISDRCEFLGDNINPQALVFTYFQMNLFHAIHWLKAVNRLANAWCK